MPQVGQDIETAILREWFVKENQEVKKGDIVASVDSDKATFEVEAFESGTILKLLYEVDDEVPVLKPIAYIGTPDEEPENSNAKVEIEKNNESESNEDKIVIKKKIAPPKSNKIFVSPAAKKIAKENNINLNNVAGSGPRGRIVKEDVINIISKADNQSNLTEEFTKMRQKISDRMLFSKQNIPHFYLFTDIDLTEILKKRKAYNESSNIKISINDIIVKAAADALKLYPKLNSHVSNNNLKIIESINIGIVVSIEDGLLVPVLSKANLKNLSEIATVSKKLSINAKNGIIADPQQATFTISNLGMFDINKFIPIINPPECAILGVGRVEKKLIPLENDTIAIREILTLSLACDHRAVDGVYGSKFLECLKNKLEQTKF